MHINFYYNYSTDKSLLFILVQEFISLTDKSSIVDELLPLCGWKINKLMSDMEGSQMASLMANLSPNILQWIKKQVCSLLYKLQIAI